MPLGTVKDREYNKFVEVNGEPAVRSAPVGGLGVPPHDQVRHSYTDGVLTQTEYLLSAVVQATVTFTYNGGVLTGYSIA